MSPLTRYGFAALVALFGVYQITHDHPFAGIMAIVIAGALVWLARNR
jgi:hypothetical protein